MHALHSGNTSYLKCACVGSDACVVLCQYLWLASAHHYHLAHIPYTLWFVHRHALLHDQVNGSKYVPLCHVYSGQDPHQFIVSNRWGVC